MDELEKRIKAQGLRDAAGGDTYGPLRGYTAVLAGLGLAVFAVGSFLVSPIFVWGGAAIGSLVLVWRGWRDASWPWRGVGLFVPVVLVAIVGLLVAGIARPSGINALEVGDCVTIASVQSFDEKGKLEPIDCNGSEPSYEVVKSGTTSMGGSLIGRPGYGPCEDVVAEYVVFEESANTSYACLLRRWSDQESLAGPR